MRKLNVLALMILVCSSVWGQEKLNGIVEIDMASNVDNNSPGITVKINDDFLYDGKYLNHYGFGFHDFKDNSSSLNGRNAYLSGYFGIDFFTGGKNRLRINSNGNVGIGTTDPSEKLSIENGNIKIDNVDGKGIKIYQSDASRFGQILLKKDAGTGLGTPNTLLLEVGNQYGTNYGQRILFKTANADRLVIEHDGNVGFGTNSPKTDLHVMSSSSGLNPDRVNGMFVENEGSSNSYFVFQTATKGGDKSFSITNFGNVGIGTTSPDAKLDVAGNIKAEEIEVTLASIDDMQLNGTLAANNITYTANGNTADFVFEEDYNLRDLSEVESFIKANKHLPEIPSAAQMEEKGVNLAEMNKLLLQKVEELTLYAIQQEEARSKEQGEREKMEKRLEGERKKETENRKNLEERLEKLEALLQKITSN